MPVMPGAEPFLHSGGSTAVLLCHGFTGNPSSMRPWAEGTENVPREGSAILASNHLSFADHFFGPLPLPRKVTFLAKAEYFTGRGLKGLASRATPVLPR